MIVRAGASSDACAPAAGRHRPARAQLVAERSLAPGQPAGRRPVGLRPCPRDPPRGRGRPHRAAVLRRLRAAGFPRLEGWCCTVLGTARMSARTSLAALTASALLAACGGVGLAPAQARAGADPSRDRRIGQAGRPGPGNPTGPRPERATRAGPGDRRDREPPAGRRPPQRARREPDPASGRSRGHCRHEPRLGQGPSRRGDQRRLRQGEPARGSGASAGQGVRRDALAAHRRALARALRIRCLRDRRRARHADRDQPADAARDEHDPRGRRRSPHGVRPHPPGGLGRARRVGAPGS